MDIVGTVLVALLTLAAGGAVGWFAHASRTASALRVAEGEAARARTESEATLREAELAVVRLQADVASAEREAVAVQRRAEEQVTAAREEQEKAARHFQALAAEALAANNKQFLELADQRLRASAVQGDEALAKREQAVRAMVDPLTKAVDQVRREVAEAEKARVEGHGALVEQMRGVAEVSAELRNGTSDLVTALRSSQTRGAWGELQLRRTVEVAGMLNRVDFTEQEHVRTEDGAIRPDMVVHLAGGKHVVVDSKVAFLGYLEAQQATDETYRGQRLDAHVRHMKKHVDDLASKRYWDQFSPAPEFVVMFVPAEAFLSSAVEREPDLLEYAARKNVIVATPMTMVALLRTVAYTWRQEALAENAAQVLKVGKELYSRLVTMTGHVTRTGRALETATKSYNQMIGSLERNVLTSARRMVELDVVDATVEELRGIEEVPRPITKPELLAAEEGGVVAIDRLLDSEVLIQELEVTELVSSDRRALESVEKVTPAPEEGSAVGPEAAAG